MTPSERERLKAAAEAGYLYKSVPHRAPVSINNEILALLTSLESAERDRDDDTYKNKMERQAAELRRTIFDTIQEREQFRRERDEARRARDEMAAEKAEARVKELEAKL